MSFTEEFKLKTGKDFAEFHVVERKKHIHFLYRFWGINNTDGKNIVDMAFNKLINNFHKYDNTYPITTYFNSFVKNEARNHTVAKDKLSYEYDDNIAEEEEPALNYSKLNIVYDIIVNFDPITRNMLIMRFRYGWKYNKIADKFGVNRSTIRGIFVRSYKKIYKKYNTEIKQNKKVCI